MTTKDRFTLTVRGHSDDILYLEGALEEELYPNANASEAEADLLALSDGTLLRVRYDEDGVWRLTFANFGPGTIKCKTDGTEDTGSDEVILKASAPFLWALLGPRSGHVKRAKARG